MATMPPSTLPPAARALCNPELFELIIVACDWKTRVALREAVITASDDPKWCSRESTRIALREVVDALLNNPNCRNAHVLVFDDAYTVRRLEARLMPRFRDSDRVQSADGGSADGDSQDEEDDPGSLPISHKQLREATAIEAIDLSGMTPYGEDCAIMGVLSNVVRLKAEEVYGDDCDIQMSRNSSEYSSDDSDYIDDCNHREFYYPDIMPPARCVVAFACPKDDLGQCPQRRDVEVAGHPNWVFDRAVYHPLSCSANCSYSYSAGPTFPRLSAAWHTVFLVPPQDGFSGCEDRLVFPIARMASIALQRRKRFVPGAHVTIVFNTRRARRTKKDRKQPHMSFAETRFRDSVAAYLAESSRNSDEFIEDALAALKVVSWAQYKASITPRQFELETVKYPTYESQTA